MSRLGVGRRRTGISLLGAVALLVVLGLWASLQRPTPEAVTTEPAATPTAAVADSAISPTAVPTEERGPSGVSPSFFRGADIVDRSLFDPPPTEVAATVVPAIAGPPPSAEETRVVVEEYFKAFDADDFEAVRSKTVGTARVQTDQVIAEVERQEDEQGVDVDLRVSGLQLAPEPPQGSAQAIGAEFVVEAWVNAFIGDLKAQEIKSRSSFRVARVPEGIRIVEIVERPQP